MIEFNKGIKVFSELFVGIQKSSRGVIPLGFATPYEDNAAGRKRQETVRNWLGYNRAKIDDNQIKIIKNTPREGFKITDEVKRVYWGGGNVVWRVEDPDGFELEIQSQNLMAIIQIAGVQKNGLIPGKCLWGRDAGSNILLHEESEEFKTAILAAETIKKPNALSKNALVIGNSYNLPNGAVGRYLGKWWIAGSEKQKSTETTGYYRGDNRTFITTQDLDDKQFAELRYSINEVKSFGQFYAVQFGDNTVFYKSVNLVQLVKENPITEAAAEKIIKSNTKTFAAAGEANSARTILGVSKTEFKKPKFVYEEVHSNFLTDLFKKLGKFEWTYRKSFIDHFTAYEKVVAYLDSDGSMYCTSRVIQDRGDVGVYAFCSDIREDGTIHIIDSWYMRQRYYGNSAPNQLGHFTLKKFELKTEDAQRAKLTSAMQQGKIRILTVIDGENDTE